MNTERISYAGTHKARAKEWELGMSDNGKEQIGILFQFVDGPHQGKHITAYLYFSEGAIDRTFESLRHCGWDSDSIAELDGLGNNDVELVIEDETYEEKTRSKVKWINRLAKLNLKHQMNPGQVAAFAERLRGKAVVSRQKYGAQPATRSAANGRQQSFDDGYEKGDPGYDDADVGF